MQRISIIYIFLTYGDKDFLVASCAQSQMSIYTKMRKTIHFHCMLGFAYGCVHGAPPENPDESPVAVELEISTLRLLRKLITAVKSVAPPT